MKEAIQLAEKGRYSVSPNPAVGCVIVKDNSVVGRGYHEKIGSPHAEIVALSDAGQHASGSEVYVTLEPCNHHGRTGPCTSALVAAGVKRVICAVKDPNPKVKGGGASVLREQGIEVSVGPGAAMVGELNSGFLKRMSVGKPRVRVKVAMSLDGNSAMGGGESKWITGAQARGDVQKLRAESCAILTGVGTVIEDDPLLNVRENRYMMLGRQPHRVILDTHLRIPRSAKVFDLEGETFVFTTSTDKNILKEVEKKGANVVVLERSEGRLDLNRVLSRLAELEINELLVEAGSRLTRTFLESGLWDELIVYLAPKILGRTGRRALDVDSPNLLRDVMRLRLKDDRLVGSDIRLVFEKIK